MIGAKLAWLYNELRRPRGYVRHRFYRGGERDRAGVALLMVITSVMLLTVLVTEITHGARVRIRLASHHRDEVAAESLAFTGVQLQRMVLMISKSLGKNPMVSQLAEMLGSNSDELWQAIPFISTNMLRMFFISGDLQSDELEEVTAAGGLSDEQRDASREEGEIGRSNFLDFEGDFYVEARDESRLVYVGDFKATTFAELLQTASAQELMALMSVEEDQSWLYENNLVKEELIANLADWTDIDDVRLYQGGYEDSVYAGLDPDYRPKNQPFDTRDEIRLVEGWHNDGVWQRFGRHLTIYGDGKVNVNSAHKPVMRGLLMAFAEGVSSEFVVEPILEQLMLMRGTPRADGGVNFTTPQHFHQFVEGLGLPLRQDVEAAVKTQADTFRVASTAEVGEARVEIITILDFSKSGVGQILYWRMR